MEIRNAKLEDLEEIMRIENIGFSSNEAATINAMKERIEKISDTFLVAVDEKDKVLGYIVGPVTNKRYINDELFDAVVPNNLSFSTQTILSLATSPEARGKGVGKSLLLKLHDIAISQNREIISLTCLEKLIPFYDSHGYVNEGIADSKHGGEIWYNMTKNLI
jgi:ribosomal protein S18 acetylase RimI-like enzyme